MHCHECGSELREGATFCTNCGAKAASHNDKADVNASTGNTNKKKAEKKSGSELYLAMAIVVISILTGSFLLMSKIMENEENLVEESTMATETIEPSTEEIAKEPIEEHDGHKLMVCVPVESISLRETPGFGEDVIAVLEPGTYLKWYGETQTVDGINYYKVVVRDTDLEGYLSERYCIEVAYEGEEEVLTLVETDTAIYTYDMLAEDLQTLCSAYPDRLQSRVIGTSADGRKIYSVILGNPNAANHIMMQAGIHGREYMTSQLVMKMLEYYAYHYEEATLEGVTYKDIFEQTALHIVPISNPDGITISQLGVDALNNSEFADIVYQCYERDKPTLAYGEDSNGDWSWVDYYRQKGYDRKAAGHTREITFEEYQTIWKANARGVDLNNNFNADWENIKLKDYPAYGSYKGEYALSEPESRALEKMALERDYRCFLSYHSRGQLIYYDVKGNSPENSQASLDLANTLDQWIKYRPVNTDGAYNVNLGGFGDWVQLALNKPSVTIESGKSPCPLVLQEFPSMWYRHKESWARLAKQFY